MNDLSTLESEVATMIVDALNLEDVDPAGIEPDQPLFNTGLGLDSIDALELALAISNRYGFQLKSDDADNARIFASLRSLAETIEKRRTK
ncbi:MAG: phosphopantetheine-binding protein [Burkholderiaceae bacterium]